MISKLFGDEVLYGVDLYGLPTFRMVIPFAISDISERMKTVLGMSDEV